jgi:DNA-binding IclR family transcriptional regulator
MKPDLKKLLWEADGMPGRRRVRDPERRWLEQLSDEDLAFLKRFLLTSGTLKDLAQQYGISYPTVRLRLDRLIEKVKLLDEQETRGPFELKLRSLYADGRLDDSTFRDVLRAYREEDERHEARLP